MISNISSKDKRVLVFSDPHQDHVKVEYLLDYERYDIAVCLGDWFDSFDHNRIGDVEKTCDILKKKVFDKNFLTLFGNHDVHYFWDNKFSLCSGYEASKDELISQCLWKLFTHIREKMQWYVWIDDFLCTHAGISPIHIPPLGLQAKNGLLDKEKLTIWLDEGAKSAECSLASGSDHWFYRAGYGRGGRLPAGGITWLDFETEFQPIEGLKQIVGHSYHRKITNHPEEGNLNPTEWKNIDIDCNISQYLIIENGRLEVKDLF